MHDPRLSSLFARYAAQGDLAALAEVFDRVSPELLRVARHLVGNAADPEDVVQATFLTAIERCAAFDSERPLVPWLMGILLNQARVAKRRRNARLDEHAEASIADGSIDEESAEQHEVHDAVERALATLPPTYREVLVQHLAEGKKPHEIARDLGRPQGTVRAQIHRGLRLVRNALPAGFALGALGLLRSNALAAMRERVLAEGARAKGLPATSASALSAPTTIAPGTAIVIGVGVVALVALLWRTLGAESGSRAEPVVPAVASAPRERVVEPGLEREAVARSRFDVEPTSIEPDTSADADSAHGSLLVRVGDGRGGFVRDVEVTLLAWGEEHWYEDVPVVRTDADGRALFEHVRAGRTGILLGSGKQTRTRVEAGRRATIDVQIEPGLDVAGRVVDAGGGGVEASDVVAFLPQSSAITARATTDRDGRFELRGVDRRCAIAARGAGRASSSSTWLGGEAWRSRERVELVLVAGPVGETLHVHVTDRAGAPLPGARIELVVAPEATRFDENGAPALVPPAWSVDSDDAGRAELVVDGRGDVALRVTASGFAPRDVTVAAVELASERTIALDPAARLVGRARFADGSPAVVALTASGADLARPVRAASSRDGSFALDLPSGHVTVRARVGECGPIAEITRELQAGSVEEWSPLVEHAPLIRGRALGETGKPTGTWLVRAVPEIAAAETGAVARWTAWSTPLDAGGFVRQSFVAPDGSFEVPCEPGHTYTLELRPRGAWLGPVQARVSGIESGASGIVLRSHRDRVTVRGRVLLADGSPAEGAIVVQERHTSGDVRTAIERGSGAFRTDVLPGDYDVIAWVVGRAPIALGRRALDAAETWDLGDVVLPRPARATVHVPESARDVALVRDDGVPIVLAAGIDPAVRRAETLEPGRYRVVVDGRDASSIEVAAGAAVDVRAP